MESNFYFQFRGEQLMTVESLASWYEKRIDRSSFKREPKKWLTKIQGIKKKLVYHMEQMPNITPAKKYKRQIVHFLGSILNKDEIVLKDIVLHLPENFQVEVTKAKQIKFSQFQSDFHDEYDYSQDANIKSLILKQHIKTCKSDFKKFISKHKYFKTNIYLLSTFQALSDHLTALLNLQNPNSGRINSKRVKAIQQELNHDTGNKNKGLSIIITHENPELIVKQIKIKFKNIKGKRLGMLFEVLREFNLLPGGRIKAEFHRCCLNEFNWPIGKYQAMNDPKLDSHADRDELDEIRIIVSDFI